LNKKTPDACMTRTAATPKEASGIMVYLIDELGDARLRCAQLKKYIKEATDLIEKSEHRDHFFEVAGHLIHGVPDTMMRLDNALDAAAMAASRLDYDEIKNNLKPEKAEELENVLQDVRMRYLNRRSTEGAAVDAKTASASDSIATDLNKAFMEGTKEKGSMESVKLAAKQVAHYADEAAVIRLLPSKLGTIPRQAFARLADRVYDLAWAMGAASDKSGPKTAGFDAQGHLQCDMKRDCAEPVTHIDNKGFAYCSKHGAQRKAGGVPCRALSPSEIKRLESHQTVRYSSTNPKENFMNAKTAAHFLNRIADLTEKGGRVPTKALMTLIAKLERQDKTAASLAPKAATAFRTIAAEVAGQTNPSRVKLAGVLRRILADTMEVGFGPQDQQQQAAQQQEPAQQGQQQQQQAQQQAPQAPAQGQQQQQAGAGEDFQKANPKITDEEAAVIDEMHDKNKDNLKG
jgi:hypothetical protein